jgi:cytochrome P450
MTMLDEIVDKMIQKKIEEMEKGESKPDLLTHLLSRDENGSLLFTMKDISDNVKTFLFAGHDTT